MLILEGLYNPCNLTGWSQAWEDIQRGVTCSDSFYMVFAMKAVDISTMSVSKYIRAYIS